MSQQQEMSGEAPSNECLAQEDKHALEMAKMNRKLALSAAEKALAENNAAEISYKYVVLQIYMKYGLTESDAIDEQGFVLRGANAK